MHYLLKMISHFFKTNVNWSSSFRCITSTRIVFRTDRRMDGWTDAETMSNAIVTNRLLAASEATKNENAKYKGQARCSI